MSNFYENIKSIRISKKLTQAVMSEKLEITEVHYNRIENDKVDISLSKMNKLAEIFGMTLIEILQYGQGVESVKEDSEKVKGLENKVLLLENRVKELTEMYNNLKVSYKYVSDSRDSFYPHLFMYNYLVMIINEKTINSFVLQRDLQENNSEYYNSLNQIIDYLKGYYMKAKKECDDYTELMMGLKKDNGELRYPDTAINHFKEGMDRIINMTFKNPFKEKNNL